MQPKLLYLVLLPLEADGFTLGSDAQLNNNGSTYVAWNWKKTATAGFDIVSYTGNGSNRTISHSLSAVPNMIIVKNRDQLKIGVSLHTYFSASNRLFKH